MIFLTLSCSFALTPSFVIILENSAAERVALSNAAALTDPFGLPRPAPIPASRVRSSGVNAGAPKSTIVLVSRSFMNFLSEI